MRPDPVTSHSLATTRDTSADVETSADAQVETVPLTSLRPGDQGQLQASRLEPSDQQLLAALGLTPASRLRVRKTGNPWILQVRSTRIGVAESVARQLMVIPDTP